MEKSKEGIILPHGMGGQDRDLKKVDNTINFEESVHPRVAEAEYTLAGHVFGVLHKTYKGHQWEVSADVPNGTVVIKLLTVSSAMGYRLFIGTRTITQLLEAAKMAGGEILERFDLPRTRLMDKDLIEDLDRDFKGEVKQ